MTVFGRNPGAFLALLLTTLASADASAQGTGPGANGAPLRIVLFIADGAGVAHWSAALYAADSLAIERLPVVGLVDPRNTSRPIPESASTATALATGVKTYYRAVGVGPDSLPRTTVLEVAEEAGLATGLVTTALITDATTAAFAAHVTHRNQRFEIARQMAAAGIEVLLGDNRAAFDPAARPDSLDLIAELRRGRAWVDDPAGLAAVAASDSVLGLVGFFPTDRDFDTLHRRPTLAALTDAALRVLDRDPDGFFLVIENEHIDHLSHESFSLDRIVAEIEVLDRALAVALEYHQRNPATLIIVIGDHETGGLSLLPDASGAVAAVWGSTNHSVELVPVFALGPGADRFGGIRSGADVGRILLDLVAGTPANADD
ncbi:MAG TPA: alkaline phosphatase [Gemmatimonadota bacterium]|nr:alkaline phosphatase [Gemmatimonadota bacterium]